MFGKVNVELGAKFQLCVPASLNESGCRRMGSVLLTSLSSQPYIELVAIRNFDIGECSAVAACVAIWACEAGYMKPGTVG